MDLRSNNTSQCLNGGQISLEGTCVCTATCFVGNYCEINYNAARLPLTGAIIQDLPSTRDIYIVLFLLFGLCGLANNILALTTFIRERIRITVCGIYLIQLSILGLILTLVMFTYIMTIVRYKADTYHLLSCFGLPFLSVVINDGAFLFTAAVAIERVLIECWNFSIYGTRKHGLLVSIIIMFYACGSNVDEILFVVHLLISKATGSVCMNLMDIQSGVV